MSKSFQFGIASCMGAIACLVEVTSCPNKFEATSIAQDYLDANFDTSSCEQCGSDGWSLYDAEVLGFEEDEEPETVKL